MSRVYSECPRGLLCGLVCSDHHHRAGKPIHWPGPAGDRGRPDPTTGQAAHSAETVASGDALLERTSRGWQRGFKRLSPIKGVRAAETTAESGGDIGKAGSETAAESAAAAGGVATRRRSATGLPALHTSATVRNEDEKISPLQAQR